MRKVFEVFSEKKNIFDLFRDAFSLFRENKRYDESKFFFANTQHYQIAMQPPLPSSQSLLLFCCEGRKFVVLQKT